MNGYPTDEELDLLIEQLEKQELYAPGHLKEEIMNKAFPKQTEQAQPKRKSSGQEPVSLFAYRLKIVTGMAAALIMLTLIPLQAGSGQGAEDRMRWQKVLEDREKEHLSSEEDLNSRINEGTRRINQKINSWFNLIETLQINN